MERESDVDYEITYSPEAEEHLRALTARQRTTIFDTVDEQLAHEPAVETRNRKPMRPNPIAPWELRIGKLRVYYDIVEQPQGVVTILAIGIKERNRVRIGDEEVEL
jgi:mRNA-degrading endonuclease RelE of RelBE toxin-antitoxin system